VSLSFFPFKNQNLIISADALAQFSEEDFAAAGYPDWVRGRFTQIAGHENDHVTLLAGALGANATMPCEYSL
jgi:hypothetical protein